MGFENDMARWAESPMICPFCTEADVLAVWLHANFADRFDLALEEPVPPELVRLAMGFSGRKQ